MPKPTPEAPVTPETTVAAPAAPATPSAPSYPTSPASRPGISDAFLAARGIVRVTAPHAKLLVDLAEPGIYIPYPGVTDLGGPFGRLRMDTPKGDKKYHQRYKTKVHNYIEPGITLYNDDLIMVEGEFKAISLIEAGFPAIGTSGFYSWSTKDAGTGATLMRSDFDAIYKALKPKRVVYVGDPDTALNFFFADAMTKLNALIDAPLALVRIDYHAPHGKGVDDIRATLGAEKFDTWFKYALASAVTVPKTYSRNDLLLDLMVSTAPSLMGLTGADHAKALSRLAKLTLGVRSVSINTQIELHAVSYLKVTPRDFRAEVKMEKKKAAAAAASKAITTATAAAKKAGLPMPFGAHLAATYGTAPVAAAATAALTAVPTSQPTPPAFAPAPSEAGLGSDGGEPPMDEDLVDDFDRSPFNAAKVLADFMMIGEEYYAYSYNPKDGKLVRSKTMSVCGKAFVSASLTMAGYSKKRESSELTPVCGHIPNLSEFAAAHYYLHATRCVGFVDSLFRPYGPRLEADGTRVFNRSLTQTMRPKPAIGEPDPVVSFEDHRIAPIILWLSAVFAETPQRIKELKAQGNIGAAFTQRDHFISMLSYAYRAAYNGEPKKVRGMFLVGKPNSGKSLLIDKIIPAIFGQQTAGDVHRLLKGEMGASPVLSNYVCKLSDKDLGDRRDIARVQHGLLSLLADHVVGGRALYENVKNVEVINLFMFSSNPDGSVMKMLQGMPESILEKIAVYNVGLDMDRVALGYYTLGYHLLTAKAQQNNTPDGSGPELEAETAAKLAASPQTAKQFIDDIMNCLPYFCNFLFNYTIPAAFVDSRFGVVGWMHDSITSEHTLRYEASNLIDILKDYDIEPMAARHIRNKLIQGECDPGFARDYPSHEFGNLLASLAAEVPGLVQEGGYTKSRTYAITGTAYREHLRQIHEPISTPERKPTAGAAQATPPIASNAARPSGKRAGRSKAAAPKTDDADTSLAEGVIVSVSASDVPAALPQTQPPAGPAATDNGPSAEPAGEGKA